MLSVESTRKFRTNLIASLIILTVSSTFIILYLPSCVPIPDTGLEGAKCFDNNTCFSGLICSGTVCVKQGGQDGGVDAGTDAGTDGGTDGGTSGIWIDSTTGYQWQNPPATNTMTWQSAVDYCSTLQIEGKTGWTLPTISQLRTLVRGCPATQTGGSCGVTDSCLGDSCWGYCNGCGDKSGCYWDSNLHGVCGWYWSSSSVANYTFNAWYVNFNNGEVSFDNKTNTRSVVRCVL